jgi:hypothetical protein
MSTFNPARRIAFIFILIAFLMALIGMACNDGPCKSLTDTTCQPSVPIEDNPLFQQTDIEKAVTDLVQDTCRQRPDGTCKVMGEE